METTTWAGYGPFDSSSLLANTFGRPPPVAYTYGPPTTMDGMTTASNLANNDPMAMAATGFAFPPDAGLVNPHTPDPFNPPTADNGMVGGDLATFELMATTAIDYNPSPRLSPPSATTSPHPRSIGHDNLHQPPHTTWATSGTVAPQLLTAEQSYHLGPALAATLPSSSSTRTTTPTMANQHSLIDPTLGQELTSDPNSLLPLTERPFPPRELSLLRTQTPCGSVCWHRWLPKAPPVQQLGPPKATPTLSHPPTSSLCPSMSQSPARRTCRPRPMESSSILAVQSHVAVLTGPRRRIPRGVHPSTGIVTVRRGLLRSIQPT